MITVVMATMIEAVLVSKGVKLLESNVDSTKVSFLLGTPVADEYERIRITAEENGTMSLVYEDYDMNTICEVEISKSIAHDMRAWEKALDYLVTCTTAEDEVLVISPKMIK